MGDRPSSGTVAGTGAPSSLVALLSAVASAPQASALFLNQPGTVDAVKVAAKTSLAAVTATSQGSLPRPPLAPMYAHPSSGRDGSASGVSRGPAPRGPYTKRRAPLSLQQKQLLITQGTDKVPHKAFGARNCISKRTIHSICTRRKLVLADAEGGSHSFAPCMQPCHFPFVIVFLYQ